MNLTNMQLYPNFTVQPGLNVIVWSYSMLNHLARITAKMHYFEPES